MSYRWMGVSLMRDKLLIWIFVPSFCESTMARVRPIFMFDTWHDSVNYRFYLNCQHYFCCQQFSHNNEDQILGSLLSQYNVIMVTMSGRP